MTVTAYPLHWPEGWPRATSRKRAKFSKGERQYTANGSWMGHRDLSIADGTGRVLNELQALRVPHGEAIISTNLELRLDGLPRSNQSAPTDPGVAVYWRKPGQPMKVMAIDIYDRVADNLAAIAATLNAMRAIERHGGAQILERAFTGFAALPSPRSWRDVLELGAHATRENIEANFRRLARDRHPDRGGSADAMAELNNARETALREVSA
ncbi:MAG TPA: J domain-containing protein [Xanthobacteraceae bacterium]|nr:J domain-containing protein [Xanthobacteraceae bacterium]